MSCYTASLQKEATKLSVMNLKGKVSMEGGRDRYTQLHSARQSLRASPGLGIVPGRRQKVLGDWSSFEGAGEVHEL